MAYMLYWLYRKYAQLLQLVKMQHNAVAAQGLAVHMPVCTAMARTAANNTFQSHCIPTD